MTVSVSDADFSDDTLTTSAAGKKGTILLKLIEGATTSTCYTIGSAATDSSMLTTEGNTVPEELGPMAESAIGSAVYELDITIDEVINCGANQR